MGCGEAEDAGGLSPVKDDNEAAAHFTRRTLLFFNCFDYKLKDSYNYAKKDAASRLSGPVGRVLFASPLFRNVPERIFSKKFLDRY